MSDNTHESNLLEALKESEEKYRALVEQSVLGICIASANPLRLLYTNPSIEVMLGYTREEMMQWIGEDLYKIIHPEDRVPFFKRFQDRLENKPVPEVYEFRGVRKNGDIVWFEVHGARIEYQSKIAVHAIFIDVTARHQAQVEAEDSKRFNNFLIDLMSHDLNNIHQGMMTGLELMTLREEIPSDSKILLGNIISQLERASELISRIKTFSDIKTTKPIKVGTDIYEPISKAIESVKNTFPNREVIINSNLVPMKFIVLGGEFLIDVFYNVLHNAVKFNPDNAIYLNVSAENENDSRFLQIVIEDQGPGIPDFKKQSILNRLEDDEGRLSGIGLALANEIINRYHGMIRIEDRIKGDYSKGSKFIISLLKF